MQDKNQLLRGKIRKITSLYFACTLFVLGGFTKSAFRAEITANAMTKIEFFVGFIK